MGETEVEVRRWGNSLGLIIPAEIVRQEGLKPRDRVIVRVAKVKHPEPGSFGALKGWRIDAQDLKDRLRREHHD